MAARQPIVAVMPVRGLHAHTSSMSIDASNCWLVPVLDQANLLVPPSPVSKKGCWKVKKGGGVNE